MSELHEMSVHSLLEQNQSLERQVQEAEFYQGQLVRIHGEEVEKLDVQLSDERMRARDLEIACHDERRLREVAERELEKWKTEALRQYPTPEAYDAACKALNAKTAELERVQSWGCDVVQYLCDCLESESPGDSVAVEANSEPKRLIREFDALASPALPIEESTNEL